MQHSQQNHQSKEKVLQLDKPISLLFSEIWFFLNQKRVRWSSEELSSYLNIVQSIKTEQKNLQFLRKASISNYKFIWLQQQKEEDKNILDSRNISFQYLNSSFRLTQAEEKTQFTRSTKSATAKNIPKSFKFDYGQALREYQEKAIFHRGVQITCPFSGRSIHSTHSLPIEQGIFYRFESQETFYVLSFILSHGYWIDSIYFPHEEILINRFPESKTFKRKSKSLVDWLKFYLVLNLEKVSDYLLQCQPQKIVVYMGHQNFAHHLFNEMQALQRMLEKDVLKKVDEFWMVREPLGCIDKIYPEILPEKVKNIADSNVLTKVFDEQALAIRIGDKYVSNALRQRVYKAALKNSHLSIINLTSKARKSCFPLLWISIRLVNRTCTNQVDAFSRIILRLFREYPTLGVVFDGFSFPVDSLENNHYQTFDYSEENIKNINKVVKEISANVKRESPSIQIFNTTGCSLYDSIVWANSVDFYLCHHGTTQHKIGWLTNKPGVVHSNQETLSRPSYPEAKGSWINCKDAVYLSEEDVTDDEVPDSYKNDSRINLKNYYLKWERAYEELFKLSLLPLRD